MIGGRDIDGVDATWMMQRYGFIGSTVIPYHKKDFPRQRWQIYEYLTPRNPKPTPPPLFPPTLLAKVPSQQPSVQSVRRPQTGRTVAFRGIKLD